MSEEFLEMWSRMRARMHRTERQIIRLQAMLDQIMAAARDREERPEEEWPRYEDR